MSAVYHEKFMQRALELAEKAFGKTRSNPMVGAVLTQGNTIISEGFHTAFGAPHAEVMALEQFSQVPEDAVVYVTLEPCCHYGKTPPCTELLLNKGVKKVVIASRDPFPSVSGKGISALQEAGVSVITGVLEKEARFLNRRFFTLHEKKRPYIILKWAESIEGNIATASPTRTQISGKESLLLNHTWRSQEMAILVGSKTAFIDNASLTTRLVDGPSPLRIVVDRSHLLTGKENFFDGSTASLYVTASKRTDLTVPQLTVNSDSTIPELLTHLASQQITSLIVEGGKMVLQSFLDLGMWDECRIFSCAQSLPGGTPAPTKPNLPTKIEDIGEDQLFTILKP